LEAYEKNAPDTCRTDPPAFNKQDTRLISEALKCPSALLSPSTALLHSIGVQPALAELIIQEAQQLWQASPPRSLNQEIQYIRALLCQRWRYPQVDPASERCHVFIGCPGSGKTTVLCKWMAQAVLNEGRSAAVWRLDSATANHTEFLNIHAEILGVPMERFWTSGAASSADLQLIDLPGTNIHDSTTMRYARELMADFPDARIHLVLNAAYESATLMNQIKAFAAFEPDDLIFTHLDEENRWGKLWNFVLGTNYSVSFLSAGQNIPGRFLKARPELLLPGENVRK
jgi:flagellar biosynthesis protein FlhF